MSEATQNLSGDFAVKLSCTSLLLEAWILEPEIISPKGKGKAKTKPEVEIKTAKEKEEGE